MQRMHASVARQEQVISQYEKNNFHNYSKDRAAKDKQLNDMFDRDMLNRNH